MTPERWEQIAGVLEQALELDPNQRPAFLDQACKSDESLRQEVDALLESDNEVLSNFLQPTPLSAGLIANLQAVASGSALRPGQVLAGRFQLVRKLGEGGMGQVWLAEQTSPVRRQVALKLIRAGMYDEAVAQRFQSERQSLAIMDHPTIAKVFDAGATPQGQPYFVMEYVPGLPITEYCDQKKLKIKDRLELFIQACEGVQHAHQKAIIHRDLKPANILVVEVDGKPLPRIIDFGLAKATAPRAHGQTLFTQLGHFVGTPGYMSPEQVDPNVKDIDTRTDVYSLGVVLYVLLAGSQPLDTKARETLPLDELLRRLREEEPPNPSERVSAERTTSDATAAARSTEPRQLVAQLRGDLDWITMKALEKDRARRYGTPSELAADLRRYLNHEPVIARPAGTAYRIRKYARRHRIAVSAAVSAVTVLAAFAIFQRVELRRITRERDRANRITEFMTDMFKVADPNEARGNQVTAREILDKASADMQKGLAKDPEVQAQMMHVMGRTYENLGLYSRADELTRHAMEIRRRVLGPESRQTLESMAQLGWSVSHEGHYEEAEKLERQALEAERRILGPEDPLTLATMDHLATVLEEGGHYGEEEKLEREVLEIGKRTLDPEGLQIIASMDNLGSSLLHQGRYAEAEQEYRQVLEIATRSLGPDHPQTLTAAYNLALALKMQGRLSEAERQFREVLAGAQRVLGPDHPHTITSMEGLAGVLMREGRFAEAEKLYRSCLASRLRTLGPEHPDTLLSQYNLADALFGEGRVHEAEELQRKTLSTQVRVLGPEDPDTLASQSNLARTLIKEGHYAEAEGLTRKSLQAQLRTLGPQHSDTIDTLQQLGRALAYDHRYPEASGLFRDVIARQEQSQVKANSSKTWYSFATVAAAADRSDDAIKYLQEAISRGYKDADGMMADDDLKSLRQNAKFLQMAADLKGAAAKAQAP